jgi:hypothetical protein
MLSQATEGISRPLRGLCLILSLSPLLKQRAIFIRPCGLNLSTIAASFKVVEHGSNHYNQYRPSPGSPPSVTHDRPQKLVFPLGLRQTARNKLEKKDED